MKHIMSTIFYIYLVSFFCIISEVFLFRVIALKETGNFRLVIKNVIVVALFFSIFYITLYIFSYLENKILCFPVTVITTEKESTDKVFDSMEICSISLEVEKMTFDSAVFNHYEKFPVKDIYLYSVEIPYSEWETIKKIDDSINESNPYIEDIIEDYVHSKIKYLSIAFIFLFFAGLISFLKVAPSWKFTKKQFQISLFSSMITYTVFSGALFSSFQKSLYPLITITLFILMTTYFIILIIVWRLMKTSRLK